MTANEDLPKFEYAAFVSYSTDPDYELVRQTEKFLEAFHNLTIPPEKRDTVRLRKLEICVDGSDFFLPNRLLSKNEAIDSTWALIESKMRQCEYLVVFCSRNSCYSYWVQKEVDWFIENRGSKFIRLVVTEGEDPVKRPEEVFPPSIIEEGLHHQIWYDFRNHYKQTSCVSSKVRDLDDARTSLAAFLNGMSAGDVQPLWYREERLRLRRNLIYWYTVAMGLGVMLALAVISGLVAYKNVLESNRQLGNALWTQGIVARDSHFDPVEAALKLFSAADAYARSSAAERYRNAYFAASIQARGFMAAFPHGDSIEGLEATSDNSRLLTWSANGCVRIWDAKSAEEIATIQHGPQLSGVKLSQDGDFVITWNTDNDLLLWNVADQSVHWCGWCENDIKGAVFFGDASKVITWSVDSSFHMWDVPSGHLDLLCQHEKDDVAIFSIAGGNGASLSSDHSKMLTWAGDGTARVWSTKTGRPLHVYRHDQQLIEAWFDAEDTSVLTWCTDGALRVWGHSEEMPVEILAAKANSIDDIPNFGAKDKGHLVARRFADQACIFSRKDPSSFRSLKPVHSEINGVFLDAKSFRFLTWTKEGLLQIWNLQNRSFDIIPDQSVPACALFSGQHRIAFVSYDGCLKLWDTQDRQIVNMIRLNGRVMGAQPFGDDGEILFWSEDGTVRVLRPLPLSKVFKHADQILDAVLNRGGTSLLTCSVDKTTCLWDAETGSRKQCLVDETTVMGARFLQKDNLQEVLTWNANGTVRFWDPATERPIIELRGEGDLDNAFLDAEASRMAVSNWNGTVRLLDLKSKQELHKLHHGSRVFDVVFGHNGVDVFTCGADGSVVLWNWHTGNLEKKYTARKEGTNSEITGREVGVLGLRLFDQDQRMITWTQDHSAYIWKLNSTEPQFVLKHSDEVVGAVVTSAGSEVLTFSNDKTAVLWSTINGERKATFPHASAVTGVSVYAPASQVLTWSVGGHLTLWNLRGERLFSLRHDAEIRGASFFDSSRILSWDTDGKIALWDRYSGDELHVLQHRRGTSNSDIRGVAVVRGGSGLLSWGHDGTARVWDIGVDYAVPITTRIEDLNCQSGTEIRQSGRYNALTPNELRQLKARRMLENSQMSE